MKRRRVKPYEQVLPFDFWENEKRERQSVIDGLPYYPDPKNDQERLFNLQKEYYKGSTKALDKIFVILLKIAPKLITIELSRAKSKRYFSREVREDIAMDAVVLFVDQIKKNELMISKSFLSYLRLQVLKAMNDQTLADRFEKYCIKNHIPIFSMTPEEKAAVKTRFEKEERSDGQNEHL